MSSFVFRVPGFQDSSFGIRISAFELKISCFGFSVQVSGLVFRAQAFVFPVQCFRFGFRVSGRELKISCVGFIVSDSRFRVAPAGPVSDSVFCTTRIIPCDDSFRPTDAAKAGQGDNSSMVDVDESMLFRVPFLVFRVSSVSGSTGGEGVGARRVVSARNRNPANESFQSRRVLMMNSG